MQKDRARLVEYNILEGGRGFNSAICSSSPGRCFAAGTNGPNRMANGCDEFRDSNLESLKLQLFSEEPIYDDLEQLKLADSLTYLAEQARSRSPGCSSKCSAASHRATAQPELVKGTKVKDVEFRKKLCEGGGVAVDAAERSDDRAGSQSIDPESRTVRKTLESEVKEVKQQAYARHRQGEVPIEGEQRPIRTPPSRCGLRSAT